MNKQIVLVALCLVSGVAGCTTFGKKDSDGNWFSGKPSEPPSRMIAFWSDAFFTPGDRPPTRGFGGRLYFYDRRSQPVPVDGQLVVYAYDSPEGPEQKTQPDRRFVFPADRFENHYSETDLGASYSVWIPWDQIDGVKREVSLIPVFTTADGRKVVGQESKVMLPGRPGEDPIAQRVPINNSTNQVEPIRAVAHEEPAARTRRKTTTIAVPPSTSRRLQQAGTNFHPRFRNGTPAGAAGVGGQPGLQPPGFNGNGVPVNRSQGPIPGNPTARQQLQPGHPLQHRQPLYSPATTGGRSPAQGGAVSPAQPDPSQPMTSGLPARAGSAQESGWDRQDYLHRPRLIRSARPLHPAPTGPAVPLSRDRLPRRPGQ